MKPIELDEQLIDTFLSGQKDDSEIAFETLVKRHGPMVLGVCRHILGQYQDAEDAFQATFLVLRVRRVPSESAGYWDTGSAKWPDGSRFERENVAPDAERRT